MKKVLSFLAAAMLCLAANAQTAFSENFDGCANGSVPTGWITIGDGMANYQQFANFGDSWLAYNGMMLSISYKQQETASDRWLISPKISVPSTGNYSLTFWAAGAQESYPESLRVLISTTTTDKSAFTDKVYENTALGGEANGLADLSAYAGKDIYIAFQNFGDGVYTFLDDVKVSVVPANAISLSSISSATYAKMGENFNINITVRNEGSANLTSFDIEYTVGNGAAQTANVTGINVAPFAYYTYTVSGQETATGSAIITATVSNPNGTADIDDTDNSGSASTIVYDPNKTTERYSIYEHFTTAVCPNCPGGHQRIAQAMNSGYQGGKYSDHMAWVAHHVGYYTDDWTISESEPMMDFFNDGGGTYAPASMIDRSYDVANLLESNPGPVFFPNQVNMITQQMTAALAMPAMVSCTLSDLTYDAQSRELKVTVSGAFTDDLTLESPRVTLYLIEDGLVGYQSGGAKNYEHDHVVRACLSEAWGDADAITTTKSGDTYSKTYTYTVPTKIRTNKARLVAFVSDYAADINKRQILNGAQSSALLDSEDPTYVGINAVEASISLRTYPNPATTQAFVSAESTIRSYEMVNSLGQKVMGAQNVNADMLELDLSNVPAGAYFITITTDHGTATEHLNVVK